MNCVPRACLIFAAAAVAFPCSFLLGAESSSKEARVTQIVRDVNLLSSSAATRPATVNYHVREGTGVRTGDASRSELTFTDLTIDRLGGNTILTFNKAGRSAELASGSLLLRVPKNSGGGGLGLRLPPFLSANPTRHSDPTKADTAPTPPKRRPKQDQDRPQ